MRYKELNLKLKNRTESNLLVKFILDLTNKRIIFCGTEEFDNGDLIIKYVEEIQRLK